ncbi:hypothetical protein [Streptomyces chartreusis]|uniref:hypothetical protein n=1 Tax=Streptomyces chartreusis TaxID=1969 RepID=UPI0036C56915
MLNESGFQPIFMPRTGLTPPELYNLVRRNRRPHLVRRGPLAHYVPAAADLPLLRSEMPDISRTRTRGKSLSAATEFLTQALTCLGISVTPNIDLSFVGTSSITFAFRSVHSLRVDPSTLDQVITDLRPGAIPPDYIDSGFLHIAYEYAFAGSLTLQREDRRDFNVTAEADLGGFITVGPGIGLRMTDGHTLHFTRSPSADPPAFAYRAGRLVASGGRWYFHPEEVYRSKETPSQRPYVPRRGLVITAD